MSDDILAQIESQLAAKNASTEQQDPQQEQQEQIAEQEQQTAVVERIDLDESLEQIRQHFDDVEFIDVLQNDEADRDTIVSAIKALVESPLTRTGQENEDVLSALDNTLTFYQKQFGLTNKTVMKNIHDKAFIFMDKNLKDITESFGEYQTTIADYSGAVDKLNELEDQGLEVHKLLEEADEINDKLHNAELELTEAEGALKEVGQDLEENAEEVTALEKSIAERAAKIELLLYGSDGKPEEVSAEAPEGDEASASADEVKEEPVAQAPQNNVYGAIDRVKGISQYEQYLSSLGFFSMGEKRKTEEIIADLKEQVAEEKKAYKQDQDLLKSKKSRQESLVKKATDLTQDKMTKLQAVEDLEQERAKNPINEALAPFVKGPSQDFDKDSYNAERDRILGAAETLVTGSETKLDDVLDALDTSRHNLKTTQSVATNLKKEVANMCTALKQLDDELKETHGELLAKEAEIVEAIKGKALAIATAEENEAEIARINSDDWHAEETSELLEARDEIEKHNVFHKELGQLRNQFNTFHGSLRVCTKQNKVFMEGVNDFITDTKEIQSGTLADVQFQVGAVLAALSGRTAREQANHVRSMLNATKKSYMKQFDQATKGITREMDKRIQRSEEEKKDLESFTESLSEAEGKMRDLSKNLAQKEAEKEEALRNFEEVGDKFERAVQTGQQEGERAYQEEKSQEAMNGGKKKAKSAANKKSGNTGGRIRVDI